MYAQLAYFDAPRTAEELAAADFAAKERIVPAIAGVAGAVRTYVLRRPDGAEVVVSLADSEQDLVELQRAVMNTRLLAGEDPALLPGPDRIEHYPVLEVVDHRDPRARL